MVIGSPEGEIAGPPYSIMSIFFNGRPFCFPAIPYGNITFFIWDIFYMGLYWHKYFNLKQAYALLMQEKATGLIQYPFDFTSLPQCSSCQKWRKYFVLPGIEEHVVPLPSSYVITLVWLAQYCNLGQIKSSKRPKKADEGSEWKVGMRCSGRRIK